MFVFILLKIKTNNIIIIFIQKNLSKTSIPFGIHSSFLKCYKNNTPNSAQ